MNGDIGEDFAVDFDVRFFESCDKGAVIFAESADSGANAGNPELTERTFLIATIAIGVNESADSGLFGLTETFAAATNAFGEFEPTIVALTTFSTSFCSCHF